MNSKDKAMRALIKGYIRDYYPGSDNDWSALVRSKRALADQIETAVLSLNADGKMHGHQRRVGRRRLEKYSQALLSSKNIDLIRKALKSGNFHNVYKVLNEETKNHYMISGLTAYDVTDRLCSAYGIEPEFVYLHTGTTVGARNLGINVRGKKYLDLGEVPRWLSSSLGPADIENFLCIFKDKFVGSSRKRKGICPPSRIRRKFC